mgnify:FL=1
MQRSTAFLLIVFVFGALASSSAEAARPVRIDWPTPSAAASLRLPIDVTVSDPRPDWVWEDMGGGVEPGYDASSAPWRVPPRESWYLEHPERFHTDLLRSAVAQLRAVGVWASPGRATEPAAELRIALNQFRCRDPRSRSQRCVATATVRLDIALLPDISVVVGADAVEPWDALADALTAAIAARVATVVAGMPDAQTFTPAVEVAAAPREEPSAPESLDAFVDAEATAHQGVGDLPSRPLGRGVADVRIELTDLGRSTRIRVLLLVRPHHDARVWLHVNPAGASWQRTAFEPIAPGVLQAVVRVPSRGSVHLFAMGDLGSGTQRLLCTRENHEIEL